MRKKLIYNTALLTAAALVMRSIGLAFQVWLVGRIGKAGIGLFQLVMSVSGLAITFAMSGIRFACTRLVSEEMGRGAFGGIGRTVRHCVAYSAFFGTAAAAILFFCAEPIGFLWIGDARTVLSLRIYALGLPFASLYSVFAGYFTAMGRVYKTAAVQISEQLLRISLVVLFLGRAAEGDLALSCASVVLAGVIADVVSAGAMILLYAIDRYLHGQEGGYSDRLTSRMLGVALPLAVSAYARNSLSTLEHLLVPRGLKAAGFSSDSALAGYGIIQGMVFPIITFPACFLMALSEMLVPDMTEAQMAGRHEYIAETANSLLEKCLAFAIGAAGLLLCFAEPLTRAIYGSAEAAPYISLFAVLAPVIYLDMVTDGMLKGLGQHMHSMAYNIIDAAISVILVYTVLPKFALAGYIAIIYFTECFNFSMSIRRLGSLTELRINAQMMLEPVLCIVFATQAVRLFMNYSGFMPVTALGVMALIAITGAVYAALHLLFTGTNRIPTTDQ